MQVTINYCYADELKEDYFPTYLEGQIDKNLNILVDYSYRIADPFQAGKLYSLQEISAIHKASNSPSDLTLTTEEQFALDGIEALGYKVCSQTDSFYI
jgi:hypothetical protein